MPTYAEAQVQFRKVMTAVWYPGAMGFSAGAESGLDRGQTREICEKQEKYFKGKVVTFTAQSLILYQYSADLLTFFELY